MKTHTKTLTAEPESLHKKSDAVDQKGLTVKTNTLTPELLYKMNAYWRAANYLSVGQVAGHGAQALEV